MKRGALSDEDRAFYAGCVEITPDPVRRQTIASMLEGLRRDIAHVELQLRMVKAPHSSDLTLQAELERVRKRLGAW